MDVYIIMIAVPATLIYNVPYLEMLLTILVNLKHYYRTAKYVDMQNTYK